MHFKIRKKSSISNARLGLMETSHGVVETPCLVAVATRAAVKTLESHEAAEANSQMLICNTFHLHLRPGEDVVKKAGGLHSFMQWKRPLMTDSGGFQVFSLGFGRDLGVGKILAKDKKGKTVQAGSQPQHLRITDEGVHFRSPVDGAPLFVGPKESMKIQEKLGADIVFSFDECTPPTADHEYTRNSLQKTHAWAKVCLAAKRGRHQALYGIVQGGKFQDLRQESARFIARLDFEGFGIGGEFGGDKRLMPKMLKWVIDELPEKKPRHLLGIGRLDDLEHIIKAGVDTFDCTIPTHYARRGIAFTFAGAINLNQSKFLKKHESLDKKCLCRVCMQYTKSYLCHLLRAGELTALRLITFHNLWHFNQQIEMLRAKIKEGKL